MPKTLIGQIQHHLELHKVKGGLFFVHPTNAAAFESILATGLDAQVVAHPVFHSNLDGPFVKALRAAHAGSTHHVVVHIPAFALARIKQELKVKLPPAKLPEALALALGGVFPHQWIVGHLDVSSDAFIPHDGFHPEHHPVWPNLQNAKASFSARKPRAIED